MINTTHPTALLSSKPHSDPKCAVLNLRGGIEKAIVYFLPFLLVSPHSLSLLTLCLFFQKATNALHVSIVE